MPNSVITRMLCMYAHCLHDALLHCYSSLQCTAPPVLIAFINFNSGGKLGRTLSIHFKNWLGADRVFDLTYGPLEGLQKFNGTHNLRVVICGGDGTVNVG